MDLRPISSSEIDDNRVRTMTREIPATHSDTQTARPKLVVTCADETTATGEIRNEANGHVRRTEGIG